MFLVAFGLGSLVLDNPLVMTGLKWIGAAVLCWLAWKIATAGPPSSTASDTKPIGFFGAAAFQWINPKSWLVCASAAATFLEPSAGSALGQSAALGLTFVLVSVPCCLPYLGFGAIVQRVLRSERAFRVFNGVMGAILAASAVFFVL